MEQNGHRAGLSTDKEDKESARTDRITRSETIAQEDIRKLIVRAFGTRYRWLSERWGAVRARFGYSPRCLVCNWIWFAKLTGPWVLVAAAAFWLGVLSAQPDTPDETINRMLQEQYEELINARSAPTLQLGPHSSGKRSGVGLFGDDDIADRYQRHESPAL